MGTMTGTPLFDEGTLTAGLLIPQGVLLGKYGPFCKLPVGHS